LHHSPIIGTPWYPSKVIDVKWAPCEAGRKRQSWIIHKKDRSSTSAVPQRKLAMVPIPVRRWTKQKFRELNFTGFFSPPC
jgi:hypothetical protein